MISERDIRDRIFKEFIAPTKVKKDYIGIEIEMPIINLNKKAVDFNVVHKVTNSFKNEFGDFKENGIDYDGNIFSLKNSCNDDIVCYDCSYNNIEFAMGKEKDLFTISERFETYYKFFKDEFEECNHTLTGMGINPYRKYNKEIPIPNERYLMLYHYLKSYDNYRNQPIYFHNYPGFGMFSSSSQVQLDVHYDDLIKTINTFSHLEPIKGLLFSNSVFLDENKGVTCFRDALWEYSTHGVNQHNIGAYDIDFESISELENYLQTLNIYCVERNGSYIDFPTMNLLDYFKEDKISGEKYTPEGYEKIDVIPQLDDIKYLRAFKFINLTFRGTLEYRSVCTQPIKDSMSVAAFHVGLNNRIDELDDILKNDHSLTYKGYNYDELRKLLIQDELPSFIDRDALCSLTKQILDLSRDGLEERGIGEEKFIDCLYDRVKNRTNPGKELIKSLKNNVPIEDMIREYGKLY